jgi:hypothetical protein
VQCRPQCGQPQADERAAGERERDRDEQDSTRHQPDRTTLALAPRQVDGERRRRRQHVGEVVRLADGTRGPPAHRHDETGGAHHRGDRRGEHEYLGEAHQAGPVGDELDDQKVEGGEEDITHGFHRAIGDATTAQQRHDEHAEEEQQ